MVKKLYAFDIEGDNLYDGIQNVWCIWIFDVLSEERWGYRPHQIEEALHKLKEADVVIGDRRAHV